MSLEALKRRAYDMTIVEEAGEAVAYDYNNNLVERHTDHDVVIQAAFDNLRSGGAAPVLKNRSVIMRGDFDNMTATVTFPSQLMVNAYGAYFELNHNDDMFEGDQVGSSLANESVQWFGGEYDGNTASTTAGSAFRVASDDCDFVDLKIIRFDDYAFHAEVFSGAIGEKTIATRWRDCWFGFTNELTGSNDGGLFFDETGTSGAADCLVDRCYFVNNTDFNIAGNYVNWLRVTNSWFVGDTATNTTIGIDLGGSSQRNIIGPGNIFENQDREAIRITNGGSGEFSNDNKIIWNEFIDNCKSADNTYDSILIQSNAGGGAVQSGRIIGNLFTDETGANDPRYHVHLDDADTTNWIVKWNTFKSGSAATANILADSDVNLIEDNQGNVAWYQSQAGGAWTDPTGVAANGTTVEVYNSNLVEYRTYRYLNGAWRYVALT